MKYFFILLSFGFLNDSFSQTDPVADTKEHTTTLVEESSLEATLQTKDYEKFVWFIMQPSYGGGTAFPIGPKLFVTAFHVLANLLREENSIEDVVLLREGRIFPLKVKKVVAVSALYDLALFETEETVTDYLHILDKSPQSDEEFVIPGYPQERFRKATGKIVADYNSRFLLQTDHPILEGYSGSPAVNTKGQVIGVAVKEAVNTGVFVIKFNHLRDLITEDTGLKCSDEIYPMMCIKQEIENLKEFAKHEDSSLAPYQLSQLYYNGIGTEKNWELSFYWGKKSAEQGFSIAQYELGVNYYFGKGTEKNSELGVYWWKKSAKQGHVSAQYNLAEIYYYEEGTERNFELAFYWYEQAAKKGHASAQYRLAGMYYYGEGAERNFELAVYWYKQAAEKGHAFAQDNLADIYYYGEGAERNFELAVYWYKQAAEQGYVSAQYNLAVMHYHGRGTERNLELAFYWLKKAADQGYAPARRILEKM